MISFTFSVFSPTPASMLPEEDLATLHLYYPAEGPGCTRQENGKLLPHRAGYFSPGGSAMCRMIFPSMR